MLFIEKTDRVLLPKKYHFTHNICVLIYDLIAEVGKSPSFKELFNTSIDLKPGEKELIDEIDENSKTLEWLRTTGRKDKLNTVLAKHLLTSISADLCSFIYESLNCAMKGKMAVAYSLIRKPLTDELHLLEQLLVDSNEFIERFYHLGDPSSYDPSHHSSKSEKFNTVIKGCVKQLGAYYPFDSDLIYQIRYDKTIDNGLNGIMNRAHHIVTMDPRYMTERQNLNFIFSMEKDYKRYWAHYYYFVPYLIIYASAIIDRIAFSLIGANEELKAHRDLRRYIALTFWSGQVNKKIDNNRFYKKLGQSMATKCKKCKTQSQFIKADFRLFLETGHFLCANCFKPFTL